MARGAFILFEGVDRCGKTTQTKNLVEKMLKTGPVELMRFPDRTTAIGQMINAYLTSAQDLDDKVIHLLFSANRWESSKKLEQLLASGTHVICDRYSYSGVAFSAAKEGMPMSWCWAPEKGLPAPDAIVYLDLSIEKSMLRGEFGNERYEKEAFQVQVRDNFFKLKEESDVHWEVMDADQTVEALGEQIHEFAAKVVSDIGDKPIAYL